MTQPLLRTPHGPTRPPNIEIITLLQNAVIQSNLSGSQNMIRQLYIHIYNTIVTISFYTRNFTSTAHFAHCENMRSRFQGWCTAELQPQPTLRSIHPILDMRFLYNPERSNQVLLAPLLGTLLGLLCAAQSTLAYLLSQPAYISSVSRVPISREEFSELRANMLRGQGDLERLRRETIRVLDIVDLSGEWTKYLGHDYYALDEDGKMYRLPYGSLWHALMDMDAYVETLYEMLPRLVEAATPAREVEDRVQAAWVENMVNEDASEEGEEGEEASFAWLGDITDQYVGEYPSEGEEEYDGYVVDGYSTDEDEEEESTDGGDEEGVEGEDEEQVEEAVVQGNLQTSADDVDTVESRTASRRVVLKGMQVRNSLKYGFGNFGYSDPRRRFQLVGPGASLSIILKAKL